MKWTKEPWVFKDNIVYAMSVDGMIAECSSEGNARRIVSAVNACAGVSNHKLELIERSGGVESLIERNIKNAIIDALVIKQRDELLAELKSAVEHIEFKHEAYASAYELITKIEASK